MRKTSWIWTTGKMMMPPPPVSEDNEEDDIFVTLARAAQAVAPVASRDDDGSSTKASPSPSLDMLNVCKCTAAQLATPWPVAIARTTRFAMRGSDCLWPRV